MATATNFQVVQQTAIALSTALRDVQTNVQHISPHDSLASCCTVSGPIITKQNCVLRPHIQEFRGLIVHLRDQVAKDAAGTAECEDSFSIVYPIRHESS